MARRAKDAGHEVAAVYDASFEHAREIASELVCAAPSSLPSVTAAADVIFTVVSDDRAMERIYLQTGDHLLEGAKGRVFINCATLSPAIHRRVEAAAEAAGAKSLEACMASSIPQAREGSLYLMCGGHREVFNSVEALLHDFAKTVRYIGPAGSAAQVKALVNMVMNIHTAGLAEGLGLGNALGLDLTMLRDVFAETGAKSRVLETDGEDMQNRAHDCFFSAAHAAKDSNIALALAHEARLRLPLAEATARQFEKLVSLGLGDLDKSGVAELTFPGRRA